MRRNEIEEFYENRIYFFDDLDLGIFECSVSDGSNVIVDFFDNCRV